MRKGTIGLNRTSLAQVLVHMRTPLFRNAYALILNEATSAALGIVYWMIAARMYSEEVVGLSAALISTMVFLSTLSQLNLRAALIRFVPRAGRATARLLRWTYCISVALAALVGGGFVLGLRMWFPRNVPLGTGPVFAMWFVVATMLWCVFAIQDGALTGLRQATWIPLENTIFGIAKIVLLLVFAGTAYGNGIFASWTLCVPLLIVPVNLLLFKRLIPQHVALCGDQSEQIAPREITRYVAGDYLGALFAEIGTKLLPIMVISLISQKANAYFSQAWTVALPLLLVASSMAAALTAEGAADQAQLAAYARRMLVQMMRLIAPLALVLIAGAPFVLHLYGAQYAAEATPLLRLLGLAALPNIVTALFIAVARVRRAIGGVVRMQAALCVGLLGLSYLWLPRYGIIGIGWAWLGSQTLIAVVLLVFPLRSLLWQPTPAREERA